MGDAAVGPEPLTHEEESPDQVHVHGPGLDPGRKVGDDADAVPHRCRRGTQKSDENDKNHPSGIRLVERRTNWRPTFTTNRADGRMVRPA